MRVWLKTADDTYDNSPKDFLEQKEMSKGWGEGESGGLKREEDINNFRE